MQWARNLGHYDRTKTNSNQNHKLKELTMKTIFQYLSAALLLIAAHNVSAQYFFNTYSGTLTIKKSLSDQCSLLAQGDQASINIFLSPIGDGGFVFKHRVDLGTFGFV